MAGTDESEINVEAIMLKIKEEVIRRKQQIPAEDSGSFPIPPVTARSVSQIQNFLDEAYSKCQRSVLPKAWDRFPFNRLGFLSGWALRSYEFLFRDQREVNFALIDAIQTLASLYADGRVDPARFQALEAKVFDKADKLSIEALEEKMANKADRISVESMQSAFGNKADRSEVESKVDWSEFRQIQTEIADHKYNILNLQRRLTVFLEETRRRLPELLGSEQLQTLVKDGARLLDAMYVSFEDKFRGTRADIKRRQEIYLPYIKEAAAGMPEAPVLDLGCGRGEWLELLRDNSYTAMGIDVNEIMVELCRDLNLKVMQGEAAELMAQQKAGSIGMVTAFHLIEHLSLEEIISVMDESLRVLKPGGSVIFETPNPENIVVGACNFYMDPTHKKPLPPDTTAYLLEARGFMNIEIKRSHPSQDVFPLSEGDGLSLIRLHELIGGPQEYAVIGWKVS